MKSFSELLLIIAVLCADSSADSLAPKHSSLIRLLPEYHSALDIKTLALYKNDYFRERYLLESNIVFDFSLLGVKDRFFQIFIMHMRSGLGRQDEAVLFDPREIYYGLNLGGEYRFDKLLLRTTVDHNCFHEVDRKDIASIYWNRFMTGVGTHTSRLTVFRRELVESAGNWSAADRFSWYLSYGYFLRDFFGLVSPGKLMSSEPDSDHEIEGFLRYALYRKRGWVFALQSNTLVQSRMSSGAFLRQKTGMEAHFRGGSYGGMLSVNYNLDNLVNFLSKDRLLEIGITIYK